MTDKILTSSPIIHTKHQHLMYRLSRSSFKIDMLYHPPQGNTVLASGLRGHCLEDAIKTIVVRVKITRRKRCYVLAIVCGHRRINLDQVARNFGGIDAHFADPATALRLTGCVSGCVMPLCMTNTLPIIADFEVLGRNTVWFNSGRLDHSIGLRTADWIAISGPRFDAIAKLDPDKSSEPLLNHETI